MLYDFYEFEDKHGIEFTAFDPQLNGASRGIRFNNDPKHQRTCNCHKCGIKISREVPRIEIRGSYYYGAGNYCLKCGSKVIRDRKETFDSVMGNLQKQMNNLVKILAVSKEVMNHKFYAKHMAMGKMLQVMSEQDRVSLDEE